MIAGAAASQDAVYVDVAGEFEGSGLCTAPGSLIYPPTLDSAGFAPSSLHPTALGQQVYADAIDGAGFVTG